jgi:hypothetical protein
VDNITETTSRIDRDSPTVPFTAARAAAAAAPAALCAAAAATASRYATPPPPPRRRPVQAFPPSIFLDKNRRDIGDSQSKWNHIVDGNARRTPPCHPEEEPLRRSSSSRDIASASVRANSEGRPACKHRARATVNGNVGESQPVMRRVSLIAAGDPPAGTTAGHSPRRASQRPVAFHTHQRVIEALWVVNGGHGTSLSQQFRHHRTRGRRREAPNYSLQQSFLLMVSVISTRALGERCTYAHTRIPNARAHTRGGKQRPAGAKTTSK